MSFIKYAFRRILRHWRLYLFILIELSFASGLLTGLPAYSNAIAFRSLRKSIELSHPVERNIEVTGSNSILTGGLSGYVNDNIGDLIISRLEVRMVSVGVDNQTPVISEKPIYELPPNEINILSIDKLSKFTSLVKGQLPEHTPPVTREEILKAMRTPPDIQAVLGMEAADELGLDIGDVLVDESGRHFPIVGIVKPINSNDDAWWGDKTTFNIYKVPGINEDKIIASLIINPSALKEYYPTHSVSWRILINHEQFSPDNVRSIEQKIINFKSRIEANKASLRTNLPILLEKYRVDISTIRMVVFLLSAQAFICILYGLILIESLILERAESEFSTMVGRGSGSFQLITIIGFEGLILALMAGFFFGPMLAGGTLILWTEFTQEQLSFSSIREGLELSLLGAGSGWLVLLVGAFMISRKNVISRQKKISRVDKYSFWQKYYLDVFLVIVSGIAYWQLSNSGSFVMQRIGDTELADPILLLAPSIFLFSISLLLLRVYPIILNFISYVFRPARGIIFPLSFFKLSRDPIRSSQVILLISIAASIILFSISYDNSFMVNQFEISHYTSGADLRIARGDLSTEDLRNIPGILDITHVFRRDVQIRSGRLITVMGVDTSTFSNIARYPPKMTNLTIQEITNVIKVENFEDFGYQEANSLEGFSKNVYLNENNPGNQLPAVFSYAAINPNVGIGDQQEINILGTMINFQIRGTIQNFPTTGNSYVLADISGLERLIDLEGPVFYANHEYWLSIDPKMYSNILSLPYIQELLISDAQQEMRLMQENAFTTGAISAFRLNILIISILSTFIFSLLIYYSASSRRYEFGVLRAEGLASRQLIWILFIEGFIVMVLGIFIGSIIGIGLTLVMRPYLNIALMRSFPQMVIYELVFDWKQILLGYGILGLFYLGSLCLAIWALMRVGIHHVMRLGDE